MNAFDRETIRCTHCKLMQFKTVSGNCRKCRKAYVVIPVVVAPKPAPAPVFVEQNNSLDMASAVRIIRLAQGFGQRELAKRAGCPRAYVSKVECGATVPVLKTMLTFAKALEVEPWVLIYFAQLPYSSVGQRAA